MSRLNVLPYGISGANTVVFPDPMKIQMLMEEFINWLHAAKEDTIILSADAFLKLINIHPFIQGNEKIAYLFMNLLLMQEGFPPVIINTKDIEKYLDVIKKAELKKDNSDFYKLIAESIENSLDICLEKIETK